MAKRYARYGIPRQSALSAHNARQFNVRGRFQTPARPRRNKKKGQIVASKNNMGIMSSNSTYLRKTPFPPSWRCKMIYEEVRSLTAGATGTFGTEIIYSLNGPYDPRYSTGGGSCYGWTQISALYSNYRVNKAYVELAWTDPNGDGLAGGYLIQAPNDADTLTSDTVEASAKKPNCGVVFLNDSGSQTSKQTINAPMDKVMGVSRLQYKANLDQYTAGVGTTPTLQGLLRIALAPLNTGSSGGTAMCKVRIVYDTLFYNRAII